MGTSITILCTITLISVPIKMTVSQFGYGYRSWFGWHPRSIAINPLSDQCIPDGGSECLRMTDCCSNYCAIAGTVQTRCEPTPCDCPQTPWGPINEYCWRYWRYCNYNEQCCSGYCHTMEDPNRHGSSRMCWTPPCKPCE